MQNQPQLFTSNANDFILFNEASGIRKQRYQEERYFSVVDMVSILTGSVDGRKYWNKLKQRLKAEGSETVTICHQLKFIANDGKRYLTDAVNTTEALRLIQSIPSPNAEPLKRRLASLGNERIEEFNNPELGVQRARARAIQLYKNKGRSDERIKKRIQSIEIRNSFTDELWNRGIEKAIEFAMITNKTYKIFGDDINAEDIRNLKGLAKSDNIRDNMTDIEIQLTQMAEVGAKEIMQWEGAEGFNAVGECVDKSVEIVKETRAKFETIKKKPLLSSHNHLSQQQKEKRKRVFGEPRRTAGLMRTNESLGKKDIED